MKLETEWKQFINRYRLPILTSIHDGILHELIECNVQSVTRETFKNTLMYKLTARTPEHENIEVIFQITLAEHFTFFKHGKPVGTLTNFPDTMLNHEDITGHEKAVLDSFMDDLAHFLKKHHAKEILLF